MRRIDERVPDVTLRPTASPTDQFVAPASAESMVGPAPAVGRAPEGPTRGPNEQQQFAQAMSKYGPLMIFSPALGSLLKGMQDLADPIIKNSIETQAMQGKLMVENSQKTFSDLVASGQLSEADNPWKIWSAKKASGTLHANRYNRLVAVAYEDWLAKNPDADEMAIEGFLQEQSGLYLNQNNVRDNTEMLSFHTGRRQSHQQLTTKHVSNVNKRRTKLITDAAQVSLTNVVSELNNATQESLVANTVTDIFSTQAREKAFGEIHKTIDELSQIMPRSEANKLVYKQLALAATSTDFRSPELTSVLESIPTNLENENATMSGTEWGRAILEETKQKRAAADNSLSETDKDKLLTQWQKGVRDFGQFQNYATNILGLSSTSYQQVRQWYNSQSAAAVGLSKTEQSALEGVTYAHFTPDMTAPEFADVLRERTDFDEDKIKALTGPASFNQIRKSRYPDGGLTVNEQESINTLGNYLVKAENGTLTMPNDALQAQARIDEHANNILDQYAEQWKEPDNWRDLPPSPRMKELSDTVNASKRRAMVLFDSIQKYGKESTLTQAELIDMHNRLEKKDFPNANLRKVMNLSDFRDFMSEYIPDASGEKIRSEYGIYLKNTGSGITLTKTQNKNNIEETLAQSIATVIAGGRQPGDLIGADTTELEEYLNSRAHTSHPYTYTIRGDELIATSGLGDHEFTGSVQDYVNEGRQIAADNAFDGKALNPKTVNGINEGLKIYKQFGSLPTKIQNEWGLRGDLKITSGMFIAREGDFNTTESAAVDKAVASYERLRREQGEEFDHNAALTDSIDALNIPKEDTKAAVRAVVEKELQFVSEFNHQLSIYRQAAALDATSALSESTPEKTHLVALVERIRGSGDRALIEGFTSSALNAQGNMLNARQVRSVIRHIRTRDASPGQEVTVRAETRSRFAGWVVGESKDPIFDENTWLQNQYVNGAQVTDEIAHIARYIASNDWGKPQWQQAMNDAGDVIELTDRNKYFMRRDLGAASVVFQSQTIANDYFDYSQHSAILNDKNNQSSLFQYDTKTFTENLNNVINKSTSFERASFAKLAGEHNPDLAEEKPEVIEGWLKAGGLSVVPRYRHPESPTPGASPIAFTVLTENTGGGQMRRELFTAPPEVFFPVLWDSKAFTRELKRQAK